MSAFPVSQSIPAASTFDAADQWNYQYFPKAGKIRIVDNATATGITRTISTTERLLSQDAPVSSGGVAGVMPTDFNAPEVVEPVKQGERISIKYRNTTGAPITVNATLDFK